MSKKTTTTPAPSQNDTLQLEERLAEMEANWKRALADYQNLQKRTREQQLAFNQLACLSLIEKLLPALDHLELAAAHVNDPGLDMVVKQFTQALSEEGVEKIEPLHQEFDPSSMECIERVDGPKDQVIEVVMAGYRSHDRIIRPAKVKVGTQT